MRIGLGAWPRVPLAEARKAAFANRCLRDEGRDPLAAKRHRAHETAKEARVPTFASAIEPMIAVRRHTWKDAETMAGQFRASLARYAGALRPIQVSRITTADVMRALSPIWHSVPAGAAALGAKVHRTEHQRTMPYVEVGQAVAAVHARSRRPLPAEVSARGSKDAEVTMLARCLDMIPSGLEGPS